MIRAILISIISIVIVVSCGNNDACEGGTLDVITMEELGCVNSTYLTRVRSGKEFELITSQEAYDDLISTSCNPSIDWESYDMIAGMILLSKGLIKIEEGARYDCENNVLEITINVYLNDTTVATPVSFAFLIPKLSSEEVPFVKIVTQG